MISHISLTFYLTEAIQMQKFRKLSNVLCSSTTRKFENIFHVILFDRRTPKLSVPDVESKARRTLVWTDSV